MYTFIIIVNLLLIFLGKKY